MADEKKIALVIQLRADGQAKAQEVTVNLKNLGAAHEDTAKKTTNHVKKIEAFTKRIADLVSVKETIKVIKDLSRALVEMVQQAVAFQSEFAPLRQGFEQSASKIKTSFATITSAALPAVVGLMTALGDAFGAVGEFVNQNRELIATSIVRWAVDSGRAIISGVAVAATIANKSIHGLSMGWYSLKAAAMGALAEMERREGGKNAEANAKIFQDSSDKALGAAAAGVREMEKFDKTIDDLVTKSGEYLGKAEKVGLEMAKKPVRIIDPDMVAKSEAALDASIAIIIERLGKLSTAEQAMSDVSFARYKLNEALKASTTADRTRQVEERLRSLDALEESLQNKYQAKYIADLGAKAQADSDYYTKLHDLQQSQAEYQAELADKKSVDKREAPKSLISSMMAADKIKNFMGPKTEEQTVKDKKTLEDYAEEVKALATDIGSSIGNLMADAISAIASGSKSALEAIGGMLGGIVTMLGQMLIQLGTAALVASALSAIPFFAPLVGGPGAAAAGVAAIAAGAVMVAAGAGLSAAIGMADGGLVVGGSIGRDSVHAMLMPGEYVVPAAQVRQNVAAGRAPDDSGARGGRGDGGAVNINVSQSSFVPGTKADFNRSVREAVLPAIRQLARQGLLVLK